VKYELGFYIPEDTILHSHRRENLKSYVPVHVSIRLRVMNNWRQQGRAFPQYFPTLNQTGGQ
jgi:hypothetical protein